MAYFLAQNHLNNREKEKKKKKSRDKVAGAELRQD